MPDNSLYIPYTRITTRHTRQRPHTHLSRQFILSEGTKLAPELSSASAQGMSKNARENNKRKTIVTLHHRVDSGRPHS